jgi:hypothetical protein
MLVDPDFVPFQPPPRPLGLRGLPTLWRNYIETIPQPAMSKALRACVRAIPTFSWSASLR